MPNLLTCCGHHICEKEAREARAEIVRLKAALVDAEARIVELEAGNA